MVSDVLGYTIDQAGFLAAMPYVLMAGIVQSAGILADLARTKGRLSTTQVIKNACHKSHIWEKNYLLHIVAVHSLNEALTVHFIKKSSA